MKIDWEHIYLLGWDSPDGKRNLTSWHGKHPWVDVVIVGATDFDMSKLVWNSPLHGSFSMLEVPAGVNAQWYAKEKGGLRAFGWYMEDGVDRPPPREVPDEWDWYNKLKGKENGN